MRRNLVYSAVMVVALVVIAVVLSLAFTGLINPNQAQSAAAVAELTAQDVAPALLGGPPLYSPPRPENAPKDILDDVMLGYHVVVDTQKYAADYVGNDLNCTNCHFDGGIAPGGKEGGLSLVGVAAKYPKYRSRQHGSADLVERTNGCFQRSQNGKPLPSDSPEMIGLMTYYHWISKDIPIYVDVPWLGLERTESAHKGDQQAGADVFAEFCAACHGSDGHGTEIAPPLWGDGSGQ